MGRSAAIHRSQRAKRTPWRSERVAAQPSIDGTRQHTQTRPPVTANVFPHNLGRSATSIDRLQSPLTGSSRPSAIKHLNFAETSMPMRVSLLRGPDGHATQRPSSCLARLRFPLGPAREVVAQGTFPRSACRGAPIGSTARLCSAGRGRDADPRVLAVHKDGLPRGNRRDRVSSCRRPIPNVLEPSRGVCYGFPIRR